MSAQLDLSVLTFESYNDYLKSFIKKEDLAYLGDLSTVKRLAKQGYRTTATVYDENEFNKVRTQVTTFLNPKISHDLLYGRSFNGTDAALRALMEREEANLLRKLSTIIFIQVRRRNGFDISGYIDYEKSLRDCTNNKPGRTNWKSVFEGKTLLRPKPSDLSYYDWHKGVVSHNSTENYNIVHVGQCIAFLNKSDLKIIPVTDKPSRFSNNVERQMIRSELYGYLILYDHVVR